MGRQAMFASINLLIFGSKTKRTVFEVNDVYRVMENSELIYTLTNSEKLKREEYKYELVNTTSRNGRMEIWLFNIGRSGHAYLRNVPISSGKNHHTSLPA